MSAFLFGEIIFSRALLPASQAELGFELVRLAGEFSIGIQLACNIVQPTIYDMLGRPRQLSPESIVFLLTESPIANVSDRLVLKYHPDYSGDSPEEPLKNRLDRIEALFTRIMKNHLISRITAYLTEGYDVDFPYQKVAVGEIAEVLGNLYADELDVPSVRLEISKE